MNHAGNRSIQWLAGEPLDISGHDDVSGDGQFAFAACSFQGVFKEFAGGRRAQVREPVETTEGDEMEAPALVTTFGSTRYGKRNATVSPGSWNPRRQTGAWGAWQGRGCYYEKHDFSDSISLLAVECGFTCVHWVRRIDRIGFGASGSDHHLACACSDHLRYSSQQQSIGCNRIGSGIIHLFSSRRCRAHCWLAYLDGNLHA
jgi:hypothetical protein